MRNIKFLLVVILSIVLTACGGVDSIDSEKAEAKVDNTSTEDVKEDSEKEDDVDDIWTYYNDATWEEDFNGLHSEIQKVVVSEIAPTFEDSKAETSAIGVKVLIENKTEDKLFTTYPDQATLVTSTGEQVEADMWMSDHIGGEIHEGVIKEGDVIFYLERGEAESVEWIKLEWNSTDETLADEGDYDNSFHTHTVKFDLK